MSPRPSPPTVKSSCAIPLATTPTEETTVGLRRARSIETGEIELRRREGEVLPLRNAPMIAAMESRKDMREFYYIVETCLMPRM